MTEVTTDLFLNGRLRISQSRRGYRFSIDPILLAGSIRPKAGERVLDLGTGCGIMPLILAARYPGVEIVGVEIQLELARLAQKNILANRFETAVQIRQADLRALPDGITCGPFDWVIANPPYRCVHSGRINPDEQRARARFEIETDLPQLVQAASRLLKTGGRFAAIYAAERAADLIVQLRAAGIEPKSMRGVHSRAGEPAKLILVQGAMRGRPGISMPAPLIVYASDEAYTPEVTRLMRF